MTINSRPPGAAIPLQVVLQQPDEGSTRAVALYVHDPRAFARRLSDPDVSVEWRSKMLRELWRDPHTLRTHAWGHVRPEDPERNIQVTADVLRLYIAAPARMAWLGQWLSRNGVALDCAAVAKEFAGLVVRRHRRSFNPAWAEGWTAWLRWMARAAETDGSGGCRRHRETSRDAHAGVATLAEPTRSGR